jgi:aldehyde:ferredoxin oxidoreductase
MDLLGKLLTIDLTNSAVTAEALDETLARRYLGGRGLNVWQMQTLVPPDVDPLGPDNALILSCGLVTGTEVPSSSRLQLAARSPQTHLLGASNVGGHFGAALRRAGYHAVRIVGRAPRPVYLWIDAHGAEIRDAAPAWTLEPGRVGAALGIEEEAWVLAIGPAGENLVPFACILSSDNHAAGRTGLGAVMGSKLLKAIAVARPPHTTGERNGKIAALARQYALSIRESERYDLYATYGNSAYINETNDLGLLGTRNFQGGQFEHADQLNGTGFTRYVTRYKTCHRCPVHCRAEVRVDHGRYARLLSERPDIEPVMAFGARIGVNDPETVFYLYNLTNELGLDCISTGGVLAFAMDLYERGLITDEDTGGLALRWGEAEAAITLTRQIARREGCGRVFSEGVREAARQIGRGAEQYAYHSKGLELPGYEPRSAQGTALAFAVSSRGADYTSVYPSLEFFWTPEQSRQVFGTEKAVDPQSPVGKGEMVRYAYIVSAVLDALGICKVPVLSVMGDFSLEPESRLVSALTGWDLTPSRLFEIGHGIITAERLINLSYGMSYQDDTLPDLFLKTPLSSGPTEGQTVALEEMRRDYYAAMGWDEEGKPLSVPQERIAAR